MRDITNYLEKPDVDAMLQAAAVRSRRDYCMLWVLWRTGVRVNELIHIRPKDIEAGNRVLTVTKAKGGRMRRIPLHDETVTLLRDYISRHDIGENDPIFPLSKQWVRELVHRYGQQIGRDDVHPHTFRHSFAINAVKTPGFNIRWLQDVLGHRNLNTTSVYLQFSMRDLQEAFAKVPF